MSGSICALTWARRSVATAEEDGGALLGAEAGALSTAIVKGLDMRILASKLQPQEQLAPYSVITELSHCFC